MIIHNLVFSSSRFGRKPATLIFAGLVAIFSALSAFSPSVEVFIVARCLVGAASIAFYTAGFILSK